MSVRRKVFKTEYFQKQEKTYSEHCCVPLCSASAKCNGVLSFHNLPTDPNLRKQWLVNIRRDHFTSSSHTKVCSRHFAADQVIEPTTLNGRRRLVKGVVPTLFEWNGYIVEIPRRSVWERTERPEPEPHEEQEQHMDVTGDHDYCAVPEPRPQGKGTEVYKKTGAIYDGDWKDGKRNGFGTFSTRQPASREYVKVYSGGWRNDKKDGYGTYLYSDSVYYEGEWCTDKRSGWGRMYFKNGDIYEGEWLEDKHHGKGILWLAGGNRYEGTWKNGKKHGPGKFFFPDKGQLYEGMWMQDVAKCGTLVDAGRGEASDPTTYPIPKVCLMDVQSVLMEAQSHLK